MNNTIVRRLFLFDNFLCIVFFCFWYYEYVNKIIEEWYNGKKNNISLIILVVVLFISTVGMEFILINSDKLSVKENSTTIVNSEKKILMTKI